jgi:uncharacterized protein
MATALVTGTSSGIGLEMAKILASKNYDLVLVARSEERLTQIASEIAAKNKVNVVVIPADLSFPIEAERVFKECESRLINISLLINNAGLGDFGMFAESKWDRIQEMIDLNIKALTQLCKLFLPNMQKQNFGRILNVASTAAFQPGPTMAVYYATKSYVLHFSEAINNELKGSGISVTALCPGPTESGFQAAADLAESKLVKGKKLPSAAAVASYGFNALMSGKAVAIHGTKNCLMAQSVRFLPRNLVTAITRKVQEA